MQSLAPNLLADYGEGNSLAEQYLSLTGFVNDLSRSVISSSLLMISALLCGASLPER